MRGFSTETVGGFYTLSLLLTSTREYSLTMLQYPAGEILVCKAAVLLRFSSKSKTLT